MDFSDIKEGAELSTEKPCLVCNTHNTFWSSIKRSFEKVKREIISYNVRCLMLRIQKNSGLGSTVCLYSEKELTKCEIKAY